MKRVYFILSFMASLFVAGCSSDLDESNSKGSIAGSVSDATTGEPVPTVNVTLYPVGLSTVTGTDGSFSFLNLEPDEYEIELSKEGYNNSTSTIYVGAGEPSSAHLLIERIPNIVTADRETLDFGDNASTNTMSFNIVNRYYEDLAWTIEERCEWIVEVKPSEGVLKYGKSEGIIVVIDRSLLDAGENKSSIVIRSSNGSSQLTVTAIGAETSLPKLNTLPVSEIKSSSAVFNGEIVEDGVPAYTERGFVYSLSPDPTIENTISKLTCTLTKEKTFSFKAIELNHSSTYYVRAYALNRKGVAYSSNVIKFNTTVPYPEVKTLDIVDPDLSAGTATFRGEITFVGIPAYVQRGFVYSTLPEPTINDNVVVANGAGEQGTYSKYVTGLPKTSYYVRAYVKTANATVYGEEKCVSSEWVELPAAGIMVQRRDLGQAYWETAASMCQNSTLGGYNDWRLPTKDELMALYNNRTLIGGFGEVRYWSGTLYSNRYGTYYYIIDFKTGNISYASAPDFYFYVRAVRSLK